MTRRRLGFWRRFAVSVVKPVLTVWTRRDWRGMEHLPSSGGLIIVVNHLSHFDPLVSAHFIYDSGRWPSYLGKASVFKVPVIGKILLKCRQIPVERGTVDAARSLDALDRAVRSGAAVVIYPEGTTTREPELWPMRGKTGAARLALATGAPVVPIVTWGPQRIFDPRTKKVSLRPRTPVTVVAGPPVDLSRWAGAVPSKPVLDEMTDTIMLRLRDMLAEVRGETPPPLWSAQANRRTEDRA
ncbi:MULTISPECIES: 1-acyl-sn-glycerol-3-phosphate acyltransferase [unclassified Plantactinospora]|uniref:lysophospholipid acyltransferase family protein n=1 Tax=unclassified Plantactinospora TaxID=2631981 RepID=UPI000D167271|nr:MULTISPECIES: lysophospholipid acyltransferase family protein [unclassified Plantactinospora]AVT32212.1 1-acyl-sn-glycerol-3-phosphate acyltransferase [Plantactinospora sp. BC1]AVT37332.1 1-acyl-sn-glycerol-3-phosphate acyltransferase [Plantactinospora sp. BB1]